MLAIWSEGLAKGTYQKSMHPAGSEARTCDPLVANLGFYQLTCPET